MAETKKGRQADKGWKDRGWYFTPEELANPPSLSDNMSMDEEKVLRKKSQVFIFDCCKHLAVPVLVMSAAASICQRYFTQVSFRKVDRVDAAAAAIFLASKVEENRTKLADVLRITYALRHGKDPARLKLPTTSQTYLTYRTRVLQMENQLVNAMGFDFNIEHPYKHCSELFKFMVEERES